MIAIFPQSNLYYNGFYIEGLHRVVGARNLTFTRRGFPKFRYTFLAMIADGVKIVVAPEDMWYIYPDAFEWCDIYAKINVVPRDPLAVHPKVRVIGPSFGIRCLNLPQTLLHVARTLPFVKRDHLVRHVRNAYRQTAYRLPEPSYTYTPGEPDYLFFAGSLWSEEPATNQARANFIRAARQQTHITFEGGFAPRARKDIPDFDDLTLSHRIPITEYMDKTKRSAVVFNTPAVHGCHGWKLGEFLALGKAIISTPLTRMLPAPLVHGEHIHFTDGSIEGLSDAIGRLTSDTVYRQKLERNARAYYEQHLKPEAVIRQLGIG